MREKLPKLQNRKKSTESLAKNSIILLFLHHCRLKWKRPRKSAITCSVFKLVFPLIFNLALLHIPASKTQGAATLVTIISPLYRLFVKFISLSGFMTIVSLSAPRLWNSLPFSVRTASSVCGFRPLLKAYLFDIAYPKSP